MPKTTVAVVGAGPAGLAVSHLLGAAGVDHVVLDRGRAAESWRSRRWDSLRLLTPTWLTRLPGLQPASDPDGFLAAHQVVGLLDEYAAESAAPVVEHAQVLSVRVDGGRFRLVSSAGTWTADAVVLATGATSSPAVPAAADTLAPSVHQLLPQDYRRPELVPDGGVLVVGASASGVQIADELRAAGRDVVLAVGSHTRMVRSYRGMDIYWWLHRIGSLDRGASTLSATDPRRHEPSAQLVGRLPDGSEHDVSLPALAYHGVRLTGRLLAADGERVRFADDLPHTSEDAQARLRRLLTRIDAHIAATGLDHEVLPAPRRPVPLHPLPELPQLHLARNGIRTVVWATGYRSAFPWLHVPVLGRDGELRHTRGITAAPGLYVVGQHWQTRRTSAFLSGIGDDAREVVAQLTGHLAGSAARTGYRHDETKEPRP